MHHVSIRLALAVLSLAALVARPAGAQFDMTGSWTVHVMNIDVPWQFVQTGTAITSTESSLTWIGTIDTATGVFQIHADDQAVAIVMQCGIIDGTLTPAGNHFDGTFITAPLQCFGPPHFPMCQCGAYSAPAPATGDRVSTAVCGNGAVEDAEQCDDGNTQNGDCCSSTCTFESAGSSCLDGERCTVDTCDGAGQCTHLPETGCRTATAGATISLRDDGAAGGRLRWSWKDDSGQTTVADFGSPTILDFYRLCVFAGDTLLYADDLGGFDRWYGLANGFVYKPGPDMFGGIRKATLRSAGQKTKLLAKGKGTLIDFAAPLDVPSVRVQLKRDGNTPCWEATFDNPKVSQPDRFVAKE